MCVKDVLNGQEVEKKGKKEGREGGREDTRRSNKNQASLIREGLFSVAFFPSHPISQHLLTGKANILSVSDVRGFLPPPHPCCHPPTRSDF